MAAGGLVPSQTYKGLVEYADDSAVTGAACSGNNHGPITIISSFPTPTIDTTVDISENCDLTSYPKLRHNAQSLKLGTTETHNRLYYY